MHVCVHVCVAVFTFVACLVGFICFTGYLLYNEFDVAFPTSPPLDTNIDISPTCTISIADLVSQIPTQEHPRFSASLPQCVPVLTMNVEERSALRDRLIEMQKRHTRDLKDTAVRDYSRYNCTRQRLSMSMDGSTEYFIRTMAQTFKDAVNTEDYQMTVLLLEHGILDVRRVPPPPDSVCRAFTC